MKLTFTNQLNVLITDKLKETKLQYICICQTAVHEMELFLEKA